SGSTGTKLIGNSIGVGSGGAAVPNEVQGVLVDKSGHNLLGGTGAGKPNVISGNNGVGVHIRGKEANQNHLVSNFIGTNRGGTSAVPNTGDGVLIEQGASSNKIGQRASSNRIEGSGGGNGAPSGNHSNVISGNLGNGVHIVLADLTEIINN